jgi:hypothetical protein
LGGESFSKRATVLVDPFSGGIDPLRELLEEQDLDYAYGVRARSLEALDAGEARAALALLEREWKERGVYTVFLGDFPRPLEREIGHPPGGEEGFLHYVLRVPEG